jgi:hypothetical protein
MTDDPPTKPSTLPEALARAIEEVMKWKAEVKGNPEVKGKPPEREPNAPERELEI